MNLNKKLYTIIHFIIISYLFFFQNNTLISNPKGSDANLYQSKSNNNLYEIHEILFNNNIAFSDSELESIISSKSSKRSQAHKILDYFYTELKKIKSVNKYLPPGFMATVNNTLNGWSYEISFFEQPRVDSDIETLAEFYNQKGFHDFSATYKFYPDSIEKKNILSFEISEGSKYYMSDIKYIGLDSIDSKVRKKIGRKKLLRKGQLFNEDMVISDVSNIQKTLLNNGYFYSRVEIPLVRKDTLRKVDSIVIKFNPGKRQKISSIRFADSLKGQFKVITKAKEEQLAFEVGDWYNKSKFDESRNNLIALGAFEIVRIDTNSEINNLTDTTLPFLVLTKYRKQYDYGFAPYINRTVYDGFWNTGLEASYFDRNFFGKAQPLTLFSKVESQNINSWFDTTSQRELEFQVGLTYSQMLLWKINNSRVGFNFQALYSRSKINAWMEFETFSLNIKFPTKLPPWTYFNSINVDFLIEWQVPVGFQNRIGSNLLSDRDSLSSRMYKTLDNFYDKNPLISPTALIFGLSLSGDTRNDLFYPSQGYFTNISLDTWLGAGDIGIGIAKYTRVQISYNRFTSLNKYTVFALKARGGILLWYDRDNSYVPTERQFFAGGANSVRGWSSRRLRYDSENYSDAFAQDFIGSRALLEGTFEVRWRFGRPRWASNTVADLINMGIMTGFIDWGNTFHWMAIDDKSISPIKYLTGLGVSAGIGLGVKLPIGPLRVDFALPVYDPDPKKVLSLLDIWANKELHFGLGFSF